MTTPVEQSLPPGLDHPELMTRSKEELAALVVELNTELAGVRSNWPTPTLGWPSPIATARWLLRFAIARDAHQIQAGPLRRVAEALEALEGLHG